MELAAVAAVLALIAAARNRRQGDAQPAPEPPADSPAPRRSASSVQPSLSIDLPTPELPDVGVPDVSRYAQRGFSEASRAVAAVTPDVSVPDVSRYAQPGFSAVADALPDVDLPKVRVRVPDVSRYKMPGFSSVPTPNIIPDNLPSSGDTLALYHAARSGDPYTMLATGGAVLAGAPVAPAVLGTYVMTEIYRRAFGVDMVDGFRSLFGKDRLSAMRAAEREASTLRRDNQASNGRAVAAWVAQNQAVSVGMMAELYHVGGYRPFMDRLGEFWNLSRPPWASPDLRDAWTNLDSPVEYTAVNAAAQLLRAGLVVIE